MDVMDVAFRVMMTIIGFVALTGLVFWNYMHYRTQMDFVFRGVRTLSIELFGKDKAPFQQSYRVPDPDTYLLTCGLRPKAYISRIQLLENRVEALEKMLEERLAG